MILSVIFEYICVCLGKSSIGGWRIIGRGIGHQSTELAVNIESSEG